MLGGDAILRSIGEPERLMLAMVQESAYVAYNRFVRTLAKQLSIEGYRVILAPPRKRYLAT